MSLAASHDRPKGHDLSIPHGPRAAADRASPGAPFVVLVLYVVLVVYIRPFEYQQYAESLRNVPIVSGMLALLLLSWVGVGRKDFGAPQYPLMLALAVCISISGVLATRWLGAFMPAFLGFVPVLILFFVAASSVDSVSRLRKMFLFIAAVSLFIAWHGIDQYEKGVGWSGALPNNQRITYVGFLNDPNDLAMALLIATPMALSFYRGIRRPFSALLALCAAGAMLYAVYLTNSRGAVLAVGAMVLVYSVTHFGPRKGLLVAPVLLAAAIALGPERAGQISASEESAAGRVEAWYDGFQMLKSYPLFGVGRGQFVEHHVRTAHNSYVLALAELGIVGYYVWFSLVLLSVLMLLKIARAPPMPEGTDAAGLAAWHEHQRLARILLYSMTGCLTAAFFLSRTYVVFLYLLIAMIVGLYQSARRHHGALPSLALKTMAKKLLLLEFVSIVLLWLTTRLLLMFG